GQETRFTSLLGVNSGDGKSNVMLGVEWYGRGDVQLKDRKFFMNGWFDPGSDAGGFIQPPGYSPSTAILGGATPSQGLPTQAAVDSIFAGYANYLAGGGPTQGGPAPTGAQWVVPRTSEIYFNPDNTPFVLSGAHGYNGPIDSATRHTTIGGGYA